ncbi:MAG TPA: hypothetical protein VLB76_23450 [Thermoanaerobaculia bacterium]|jgi:ELWxxDGT repeat protein|nr:hypothetical protein [Thermoanaerobaculia bacterium]
MKLRALLLLLLFPLPALAAGPAHLVADIDPGVAAFNPEDTHLFTSYTAVNGRVVFFGFFTVGSGFSRTSQCGLWEIDVATGAGELLASVCAGDDPTLGPLRMIAATGRVVFFSDASGRLWRTDATAAGTFPLRGVKVRPPFFLEGPPVLGPDGRTLYFAGCVAETGCEPWRSDGTRAGTRPLADLRPGPESSNPAVFTVAGSRVLFAAGGEVWSVAGGAAATPALIGRLPVTSIQTLLLQGQAVYVLANRATLYRFDLTTGRVRLIRSFPFDPRHGGGSLQAVGGRVLFAENDPESEAYLLWQVEGARAADRPARLQLRERSPARRRWRARCLLRGPGGPSRRAAALGARSGHEEAAPHPGLPRRVPGDRRQPEPRRGLRRPPLLRRPRRAARPRALVDRRHPPGHPAGEGPLPRRLRRRAFATRRGAGAARRRRRQE